MAAFLRIFISDIKQGKTRRQARQELKELRSGVP